MSADPVQLKMPNMPIKLTIWAECLCWTGISAVIQNRLHKQRQSSQKRQRLCPFPADLSASGQKCFLLSS